MADATPAPAPRRQLFRVDRDALARDRQLQARGIPLPPPPAVRDPTPPHPRCHGRMVVEADERMRTWWCYLCLACGRRSPTYRRAPPPPPPPAPPSAPPPAPAPAPAPVPEGQRRWLATRDAHQQYVAARRDIVAALAASGLGVRPIARALGYDASTIRHDLRCLGLLPRPTDDAPPTL